MKSQNFEFLRAKRAVMADLAAFAERYAHSNPTSSLIKQRGFIEQTVIVRLEEIRLDLRGIMKYQEQVKSGRVAPRVYDVTDDDFSAETHIPKLEGFDYVEHKRRVEAVLRDHFAQNPILQRIRVGKAVRDEDLEELTRLCWRSTTRS